MRAIIGTIVVLLCATLPAAAGAGEGSILDGTYVGINVNTVKFTGSDMKDHDAGMGGGIRIGHRFEAFAIDLGVNRFGNALKDEGRATWGDLNGFALDARWFFGTAPREDGPYLLAGIGLYWFNFKDSADRMDALGLNLGGGYELFLEQRISLAADVVYRVIRFDEVTIDDVTTSLDPKVKGDAVTATVALLFHF